MGLNITQLLGINLQIFEGDVKPIPKGDIYQPPQGKFGGMEKESRHTAIGIAAGQVCDRIMGGFTLRCHETWPEQGKFRTDSKSQPTVINWMDMYRTY